MNREDEAPRRGARLENDAASMMLAFESSVLRDLCTGRVNPAGLEVAWKAMRRH